MKNYQKLTEELDQILDDLQTGALPFDQAITKYEKGMELIKKLEDELKLAENKITKIQASLKED